MVAMSTSALVQAARGGNAEAVQELATRGRDASGVKTAWTASPKYKSDSGAASRVTEKFASGRGLLKPRYEWPGGDRKAPGARTNPGIFGDLLFDLD